VRRCEYGRHAADAEKHVQTPLVPQNGPHTRPSPRNERVEKLRCGVGVDYYGVHALDTPGLAECCGGKWEVMLPDGGITAPEPLHRHIVSVGRVTDVPLCRAIGH
jgi:hypothetical protein